MDKTENIDSIYKNIGIFGTIGLKHRVVVYSNDSKINKPKPYKTNFTSKRSKGGMIGFPSYSFRSTNDMLIIENADFELRDSSKIRNSVYLTYDDISEVKRIIKESLNWFEDSEIKNNLFVYENNNPYKISDTYRTLHSIMYPKVGIKSNYLTVQPAVITDFTTRLGYPGIVLKTITGTIGCCTISEYKSMCSVVLSILNDLYKTSLELLNHHMLTELIGGKLKNG